MKITILTTSIVLMLLTMHIAPAQHPSVLRNILRDSLSSLAERASKGQANSSSVNGWIAEYNALLNEAKAIFNNHALIQVMQPLQPLAPAGDAPQMAGTVAATARRLEQALAATQ